MSSGVLYRSLGPEVESDGHDLRSAAGRRARYGERDDGGRQIGELCETLQRAQQLVNDPESEYYGRHDIVQMHADAVAQYGDVPQPPKKPLNLWGDLIAATYPEGKP